MNWQLIATPIEVSPQGLVRMSMMQYQLAYGFITDIEFFDYCIEFHKRMEKELEEFK